MPDEILENILQPVLVSLSLSEFSFFKLAFAFADQNPPGSGTFDLSVGPF